MTAVERNLLTENGLREILNIPGLGRQISLKPFSAKILHPTTILVLQLPLYALIFEILLIMVLFHESINHHTCIIFHHF
jgi:hypothetical protein